MTGPASGEEHPAWCDPAHCMAGDPVWSHHASVPVAVDPPARGDPRIMVRLVCSYDQPPQSAGVTAELTIDRGDLLGLVSVESYPIEAVQHLALLAALQTFAGVMATEAARAPVR